MQRGLNTIFGKQPQKESFAVPCSSSPDGHFYVSPEFQGTEVGKDYTTVFVDTKKLLAHMREFDPEMLKHAEKKFRGETPQDWINVNSKEKPYNTGSFVCKNPVDPNHSSPWANTKLPQGFEKALWKIFGFSSALKELENEFHKPHLSFHTGNAGMFVLAEKLNLPCIPIQVQTGNLESVKSLTAILNSIGYTGSSPPAKILNI